MKLLIALLTLFSLTLHADWPQWRGPDRDGALTGADVPKNWPEKLNRKWRITVGEGHASPVLAAGKLYAFARKADRETLYSIDPSSGKILWEQSYAAPYSVNPAAAGHGPGPKSTPVVHGGRVYTLGISGILTCFDAGSGRVAWQREFAKEFKSTSPDFGTAMSPIVDGGIVIAHVGGSNSGALAAFDATTGATKWSWKGDGPGYASPIIVTLAGVRQIVTQTQQNIIAVSAATGELVWKMPYTTPFVQNIVTPLVYRDTLILSGLSNSTMAIRVVKQDAGYTTEKIWENKDAPMYMSSPVLNGDYLFGMTHKNRGQFVCLDARSGKTLWSSPPRQADNTAIELAGNDLALLKDDAELIIARATEKGYEPVHTYKVADSSTYAHPVITAKGVFVKDKTTLALWTE